ncbi:MAG TPA: right-handed parallel beta-helix repeat-containing protein [Mycobacteriales bacterium]|nr:right-handed parallel beta-helix repeat-containing protein [Mycobacteriales bacterium]
MAVTAAALVAVPALSVAGPSLVYVSPSGSATNDDSSCAQATQTSIQTAVDTVSNGGTVIVCAGTYAEQVDVTKQLTLQGQSAVIDATGKAYGIGLGADYVTVRGMTVENATSDENSGAPGDGIVTASLVGGPPTSSNFATITGNILRNNGGAGIDLQSTHGAIVASNSTSHNGIGINISNDLGGPSRSNRVVGNLSNDNGFCGIVMADHTGSGIFGNAILGNVANRNGAQGGAGILMATPTPNGSVRNNTIRGNQMVGNGHAGLEVHVHVTGADFSGNTVVGNTIGTNNLKGDYKDPKRTGIYVGSRSPLKLTVDRNVIYANYYGVFTAGKVTLRAWSNGFSHVTKHYGHVTTYAG